MMGHHRPEYQRWIEAAGYAKAKDLLHLRARYRAIGMIPRDRPAGRGGREESAHPHPQGRQVELRRRKRAIILDLLNDAWSDNWGFVPLTEAEIAYAGKKLKPIIYRGSGPDRRI